MAAKLRFMDVHGIDKSIISLANPWLVCLHTPTHPPTHLPTLTHLHCARLRPGLLGGQGGGGHGAAAER